MPMDSAVLPLLVKPAPVTEAEASANRPSAEEVMAPRWRAMTAWTSTASAPSPSSSPITMWMLSIAGPLVIALPRPRPWSPRGTATYKLTYIPIAYSATISTMTARLPRRTLARPTAGAVLTGRAGDFASRLICSPHCSWAFRICVWPACPGCDAEEHALAVAWRAGDPARDRAPVLQVAGAEAAAQPGFFVAGDEQVEEDRHRARVGQQRQGHEQPRLPADDQERGEVDRVAHPAVGPCPDHPPRCVPQAGRAASHRGEVPDAP